MKLLIPSSGYFWTRRPRALLTEAAPTRSSSALRGGKAAGWRSSSSSCASTARNARYCSLCVSGSRSTRCSLRSTEKWFDWSLLETRYRMSRKIADPVPRAHLDFLHPARNLWRLRLGSVRLSELERHVLGWDRGADVLSDLIPRIYLDFMRGGPPERLIPVFHHNQMDLRGLAALSSRVLSLVSDAENVGQDGLELFGVSRICEKRGENARARKLYEKSIASVLPTETDRAARHSLARLAKREGDFNLACELWKEALGNSRQGYDAYEQLAMYYEHKARDPEQARQIVRQALDELRRANQVGDIAPGPYREIKARFDQRMTRLERKSRRPLLDLLAMESQAQW